MSAPAVPIRSTGDVPGWLKALGVGKGGFYTTSKARTQRMMKDSLTSEARQIYACLELATMGFQQERAVTMKNGAIVPLTRKHIADSTGLSEQHVRRGIVELEEAGLAERRPINGPTLLKGNVEIYCWAIPRTVPEKKTGTEPRDGSLFAKLGEEFQPLTRFAQRWKIRPQDGIEPSRGSLLKALEAIANAEKANLEAVAIVKGVIAPSRPNKEERNREKHETTTTAPPPVAPGPQPVAAAVPPLPDPPPEPPPVAPPEEPPPAEPTLEEVAEVRRALSEFGTPDYKTAKRLIVRCRAIYRDATTQQIGRKLSERASNGFSPSARSRIGILMDAVPEDFRGFEPERDWDETAKRKVEELEKLLLDPDCLSVVEAEEYSGLSADALFDLIESGRLPALDVGPRSGGKYRIMRGSLDSLTMQLRKDE